MPKIKRTINYVPSINYLQTLAKKQFVNVISDSIQNLYTQMLEIIAAIDNVNVDNSNIDIQSLVNINTDTGTWIINGIDTGVSSRGNNGITPHIDKNTKTWFIGNEDTKIKSIITFSDLTEEEKTELKGNDGLSAYEVYRNNTSDNPKKNVSQWLASLIGNPGRGIESISITYQVGSNGTDTPDGDWLTYIPSTSAGQYLWTKIAINYSDNSTPTIAYCVSRNGTNGSNGGGSSIQVMTINTIENAEDIPSITVTPNVLNKFSNVIKGINVTLTVPNSNEVGEYVFRFKTDTTVRSAFFNFNNANVLYPFDYIINANTEYEVVLTYDGYNYLLNYCAYQSNT